jgi:hypothetical protein
VRPERDRFGPPRDRPAHGLFGVLVRPGGVVGLLPCVVVVVAVGVGVGAVVLVGVRVGTAVGGGTGVAGRTIVVPLVGAVVAAEIGPVVLVLVDGVGVEDPSLGVLDCSDAPLPGLVGRGVSAAASTGGTVDRGFAGSGSGISGVSMRGPPRRLLAMRMS